MLVIEILFIVFMVIWLASNVPNQPYPWISSWLPWVCVALLGLAVFLNMPMSLR